MSYEQAIAHFLSEKLPLRTDFQRLSLGRNMRKPTEPTQIFGNSIESIGHPNQLINRYSCRILVPTGPMIAHTSLPRDSGGRLEQRVGPDREFRGADHDTLNAKGAVGTLYQYFERGGEQQFFQCVRHHQHDKLL